MSLNFTIAVVLATFSLNSTARASFNDGLEYRFRTYHSLGEALFEGPNNFHAAAYILNWTERFTFMSPEEFGAEMTQNSCYELLNEAPQKGDLGLVVNNQQEPGTVTHAFVWKTTLGDLYFKAGPHALQKLISTTYETLQTQLQLNCNSAPFNCVKNFRCKTGVQPARVQGLLEFENYVSSLVVGSRVAEDSMLQKIEAKLVALKPKLGLSSSDQLTRLKIDSLLLQIQMIQIN